MNPISIIYQRLLCWLLYLANTDPPYNIEEFYPLKRRLLDRYGTWDRADIQEITDECYGWGFHGCTKDRACKCGGNGIYRRRWYVLERRIWCGRVFHLPNGDRYGHALPPSLPPTIYGRIGHKDHGRLPREAVLWLFLLCGEWGLLWHAMWSSCSCGWYAYPLMNIQRIVMNVGLYFNRRTCYCGKRFFALGKGWCMCRKCRNKNPEYMDLPF